MNKFLKISIFAVLLLFIAGFTLSEATLQSYIGNDEAVVAENSDVNVPGMIFLDGAMNVNLTVESEIAMFAPGDLEVQSINKFIAVTEETMTLEGTEVMQTFEAGFATSTTDLNSLTEEKDASAIAYASTINNAVTAKEQVDNNATTDMMTVNYNENTLMAENSLQQDREESKLVLQAIVNSEIQKENNSIISG